MNSSRTKILVTHTGSLPRPDSLAKALGLHDHGKLPARQIEELPGQIRRAVNDVVGQQIACGVDIVSDGEASKIGYSTYVKERLTGFGDSSGGLGIADLADTPELAGRALQGLDVAMPACIGPVRYRGATAVCEDISNLKAALQGRHVADAFMSAASPGVISVFLENRHYPDDSSYLQALAEAMREEYLAIHQAGFLLQIDSPDLAMGRHVGKELMEIDAFRKRVAARVEILNYAVRGIPAERLRVHLCWGNYGGPHHHDVPLHSIIDLILKLDAKYILFEGANPRHEHEWRVFEETRLPDGKVLIPGVIDTCTNYVEHPQVVADRITRYVRLVGSERVIAGTDCGFATFASFLPVDPKVAWMKLKSLAEGAALASSAAS
jgi:5-methyltetrahydropteroyltriglutamate--homocysteine methyltransferase